MLTKLRLGRGFAAALAGCVGAALLGGCAGTNTAPIEQKSFATPSAPSKLAVPHAVAAAPTTPPSVYRVVAGDTLYSIAWRYGLDARDIGRWNKLDNFNRILVGQSLVLRHSPAPVAPASRPAVPAGAPQPTAATPIALAAPLATQVDSAPAAVTPTAGPAPAASPAPTAGPASTASEVDDAAEAEDDAAVEETSAAAEGARSSAGIEWRWPATGTAKNTVVASGAAGLDITGQRGQPVYAAAAGQVVYSGNGLRGYGQLVIIKHSEVFLSAYAHNDKLLVSEGAQVRGGQQIAAMGDSDADVVALHFEIRKNGKAVEPRQFLPAR